MAPEFERGWANNSPQQDVLGSDDDEEEDMANRSSHQDPFDNEEEAEVDLEGELVNTLEELNRVRREYKLFKNVAIVE